MKLFHFSRCYSRTSNMDTEHLAPEQNEIIRRIEKYISSNAELDLQKLDDSVKLAENINPEILEFIKGYLQVRLNDCNSENYDNASARFGYYDIAIHLSRSYGIIKIIDANLIKSLISEVNVYKPLETSCCIQSFFTLIQMTDFKTVLQSSQEAITLLEQLFEKLVYIYEKDDETIDEDEQIYVQDELFLISILKLVTIINPKIILMVKKFEKFSKNFAKIYIESLGFITKTAKFDEFNVNLNPEHLNLLINHLNSINLDDQKPAITACQYLSIHDFEKVKQRLFRLVQQPDLEIRKRCLETFVVRSKNLAGCKSLCRIIGFLDWLLLKRSESNKENTEIKFEIVKAVQVFARNQLKLHSKIQLELARFVKDGPHYDSTMRPPETATEEM